MTKRIGKKSIQERLYIAYGSSLGLLQMERRYPTTEVVGTSEIKNYELLFRGVTTMESEERANAPVLLWRIKALDEVALDRYEGWPHLHQKEMMDVELGGKSVSAMVYVINDVRLLRMPLESYYKMIEERCQTAGFDTVVPERALKWTKEMVKREELQYHQQCFYNLDGLRL